MDCFTPKITCLQAEFLKKMWRPHNIFNSPFRTSTMYQPCILCFHSPYAMQYFIYLTFTMNGTMYITCIAQLQWWGELKYWSPTWLFRACNCSTRVGDSYECTTLPETPKWSINLSIRLAGQSLWLGPKCNWQVIVLHTVYICYRQSM